MTLADEFGIVSRNRAMRARYGDRKSHGTTKGDHLPPMPHGTNGLDRKVRVQPPFVVPTVIPEALMRRADKLGGETKALGARLSRLQSMATEIEALVDPTTRPHQNVPPAKIIGAVLSAFDITMERFMGPGRGQQDAQPRHAFCRLARRYTRLSTPAIARVLGRDHTSILNSLKRAQKMLDENAAWRAKYDAAELLISV